MGVFVWKYGANVVGIKKKCRKFERHFTDKNELGEVAIADPQDARELAKKWALANMREVKSVTATATLWSQGDDGCETWEMFNQAHNLSWPVTL